MLYTIALLIFLQCQKPVARPDCYSAWTENGLHLMISDNGTPDDLEDDFICDWEDNRVFKITILD